MPDVAQTVVEIPDACACRRDSAECRAQQLRTGRGQFGQTREKTRARLEEGRRCIFFCPPPVPSRPFPFLPAWSPLFRRALLSLTGHRLTQSLDLEHRQTGMSCPSVTRNQHTLGFPSADSHCGVKQSSIGTEWNIFMELWCWFSNVQTIMLLR